MNNIATLVTVQGDKVHINVLDPISRNIWLLHVSVSPDALNERFLFWIQESAKMLHGNGAITVEIRK